MEAQCVDSLLIPGQSLARARVGEKKSADIRTCVILCMVLYCDSQQPKHIHSMTWGKGGGGGKERKIADVL